MKIKLHMWDTKCNYKRNESGTCSICRTEEDTMEHIMVCQEGNNKYNLLDENEKDWENIVATYWNNKENMEKLEQKVQKEKIYNRTSKKYNKKVKWTDTNTEKEMWNKHNKNDKKGKSTEIRTKETVKENRCSI